MNNKEKLKFNPEAVNPRIFVVGCSRSGTTLLQTLIASHPEVNTFPETGFFLPIIIKETLKDNIKRNLMQLGFDFTKKQPARIRRVLKRLDIEENDLNIQLPNRFVFYQKSVETYLSVLDDLTLNNRKKSIWIEKTPLHLFNVDLILKYVPNAKIIHIVRSGPDVVASIIDRQKKYNKFKNQNLEYAINLWNNSLKETNRLKEKKDNYVVKYEDLVATPHQEINKIGKFLNLDYKDVSFSNRKDTLGKAVLNQEKWKTSTGGEIINKNDKYENIFTDEEKEYINKNLKSGLYNRL